MLTAIRGTTPETDGDSTRRRELTSQLERLQDLYVMGDMTKAQYVMRRQALEDELERIGPPTDPQLDQAAALLADFGRFWEIEPSLARYLHAAETLQRRHQLRVVPKAGATGVKPPE